MYKTLMIRSSWKHTTPRRWNQLPFEESLSRKPNPLFDANQSLVKVSTLSSSLCLLYLSLTVSQPLSRRPSKSNQHRLLQMIERLGLRANQSSRSLVNNRNTTFQNIQAILTFLSPQRSRLLRRPVVHRSQTRTGISWNVFIHPLRNWSLCNPSYLKTLMIRSGGEESLFGMGSFCTSLLFPELN